MDFLVNDLSLVGQFQDIPSFHAAVERLMKIRQVVRQHGSVLYCHRKLAHAQVTPIAVMQRAVQGLPLSQQRAWMQWLTMNGPYWEDARVHGSDDYLDVNGDIVTDTAIGETAICRSRGLLRELISFDPSAWLYTPIKVNWIHNDETADEIPVPNSWDITSVQARLTANPRPIVSWVDLAAQTQNMCTRLTFAADTFESLRGRPFSLPAANQIRMLLHILNQFKGCFDAHGHRNPEGHRMHTDYFTGDNAYFSDSSAAEKTDFRSDLTFAHPAEQNRTLFCTWHGKVRTHVLRIHFSWPVRADTPLYVVYVGPKITKR